MRMAHRTPAANWFAIPVSDTVDPEYEAKVQQATRRAEREYQKAQERFQRAEERLVDARRMQRARKLIAELADLVELRRTELEDYRKLMTAPPVLQTDKQVRHRTGLDDHLELGVYKKRKREVWMQGRLCIGCHGEPPAGFTCNTCGRSGP